MHALQTRQFDAFSTVPTNGPLVCVSRCDLLLRAFSNRCIFDENAQRIRPKRIEMYAFSNEKALSVDEAFSDKDMVTETSGDPVPLS